MNKARDILHLKFDRYTDYSPLAAAILTFLLSSATQLYTPQIGGLFLKTIPNSALVTGSSYFLLLLSKRFVSRSKHPLRIFLIISILFGLYLFTMMIALLGVPPSSNALEHSTFIGITLFRTIIASTSVLGITGFANSELRKRNMDLISAIKFIEKQDQKHIAEHDSFRDGVAHYLHDEVQSKIFLNILKLRDISSSVQGVNQRALSEIIESLSKIQRVDIRSLAHLLSPNIKSVGLEEAIEDLIRRYSVLTSCSIEVAPSAEQLVQKIDSKIGLATYRLVESALSNAVIHGACSQIEIRIYSEENSINISVQNNGLPVSKTWRELGVESTTLSHWLRVFNGSSTLENLPDGGVKFEATLRI